MSAHRQKLCLCLALALSVPAIGSAQDSGNSAARIQIRSFAVQKTDQQQQRMVAGLIRSWCERQGARVDDSAEWIIWFETKSVEGAEHGNVLLSVGLGHALPDEVIELGSKSEVFYAGLSDAKKASLPREGKFIREYVTGNFLREFIYPLEERLVLVSKEDLASRIDAVLDDVCGKCLKLN